MKKHIYYTYLGENGTITTQIKLEGAYSVTKYMLVADNNKKLTKDNINFVKMIMVPASEADLWYEV